MTTPRNGSPSPDAVALLTAYRRWKAAQENPPGRTPAERTLSSRLAQVGAEQVAGEIAGLVKSAEIERAAYRKSVSKVTAAYRGGADPRDAIQSGFKKYRDKGGSASLETWRRRIAEGR